MVSKSLLNVLLLAIPTFIYTFNKTTSLVIFFLRKNNEKTNFILCHHTTNLELPTPFVSINPDFKVNENAAFRNSEGRVQKNIYAQRYINDGSPLGNNYHVDDHESWVGQNYGNPSITIDQEGNYIITWYSESGSIYTQLTFMIVQHIA